MVVQYKGSIMAMLRQTFLPLCFCKRCTTPDRTLKQHVSLTFITSFYHDFLKGGLNLFEFQNSILIINTV